MTESSRAHRLHLAALGLWIGVLFTAGLTAAIAFPAMKRLSPVLPGFPGAPESEHWSIAAGHIANPVLNFAVWAQIALAAGAVVTLWLSRPAAGWMTRVRFVCIGGGMIGAAWLLLLVVSVMRPSIAEYWRAAAAGDAGGAGPHKARFDAVHPTSSRLMGATLGLASGGLVLAVARRGERLP